MRAGVRWTRQRRREGGDRAGNPVSHARRATTRRRKSGQAGYRGRAHASLRCFGRAVRGRRSRVVPAPGVLASSLAVTWRPNRVRTSISREGDGGNSAPLPEESTKDTVKTIRAGKAGRPASPV